MGCDIHSFAEVKKEGKWERVQDKIFSNGTETAPFDWRGYGMFAFLADVRNYSCIEPITAYDGLPDDSEYLNSPSDYPGPRSYWTEEPTMVETIKDDIRSDMDYHSLRHIYLNQLIEFDYEKTFEDRRTIKQTRPNSFNGAHIAEEGEGEIKTYREFLGQGFFDEIESLKTLGEPEDVRVIFWFDN